MKKKNLKSLIALGFASTLVLAACGGATDDAETDTSAGVDTTEETGGAAGRQRRAGGLCPDASAECAADGAEERHCAGKL